MAEISEIKMIRDFLTVIKNVNLYFLIVYNVVFNRNKFTDIFEFIKLFKQFYRFNNI